MQGITARAAGGHTLYALSLLFNLSVSLFLCFLFSIFFSGSARLTVLPTSWRVAGGRFFDPGGGAEPGRDHRPPNRGVGDPAGRDAKFTAAFDAVLTAVGVRIIKMPVQAPRANAIAESWIASARRECLDRMLIVSERHLRLMLSEYVDHYNLHPPHRVLRQMPPVGRPHPPALGMNFLVPARDPSGGVTPEYSQVA